MNKLFIKSIRSALVERLIDAYPGFADYLEFSSKLDEVVTKVKSTITQPQIYLDDSGRELMDEYTARATKVNPNLEKHFAAALYGEIFAHHVAEIAQGLQPNLDQIALLRYAAVGMVSAYNVEAQVGLSGEEIGAYADDTLALTLTQLKGDSTMGPNYSDFQCVAVPKLVKMARNLMHAQALTSCVATWGDQ